MSLTLVEQTTLPSVAPWYSYNMMIQDTFNEATGTLMLWEAGCRTVGGWNCTEACLDLENGPAMLWNSEYATYTLHNCMVYPIIAAAHANGSTVVDPANLTSKYQIPGTDGLVVPMDTALAWPVITKCFSAYCNDSTAQNDACNQAEIMWESNDVPSNLGVYFVPRSLEMTLNLCNQEDGHTVINADIGGTGVTISYIIQMAILLAAWVVQSLSRTWIKWLSFCLWLVIKQDRRVALAKANRLQRRCSFPRQSAALMSALVEFQKTQVFFILTVQVASLMAMYNATYVQASSWEQFWVNVGFFYNIAGSGVYPVVFGLLILRKAKKASCYLVAASTCCVVVSMITWFTASHVDATPQQITTIDAGPSECGNNLPTKYCLGVGMVVSGGASIALPLTYVLIAVVIHSCIVVEKFEIFRGTTDSKKRANVFQYIGAQARSKLWTPLATGCSVVVWFAEAFAETWLLYANTFSMIVYYFVVMDSSYDGWQLGQIIAVAVWVPVFVEWLYLSIVGIKKGFKYRLVAPYHVVRRSSKVSAAGDDTSDSSTSDSSTTDSRTSPARDLQDRHDDATSSAHELPLLDPSSAHGVVRAKTWSPA